MTLLEILVVLTVIALFTLMLMLQTSHHPTGGMRINCSNNLKQLGLATRIWEGDNNDKYPPQVSVTNGGSMELTTGPNVWRTFQVMSNEMGTPKIAICPQDSTRFPATNFTSFNNSNVSFFYGVDAGETNPAALLVGDRNLTNDLPLKNAVMELTTNQSPRWTKALHQTYGNIGLADGSVRQIYPTNFQALLVNSGLATNRLQMPILGP